MKWGNVSIAIWAAITAQTLAILAGAGLGIVWLIGLSVFAASYWLSLVLDKWAGEK